MAWHAKPSGGWSTTDTEAQDNMIEIYNYLSSQGWSDIAVAGLLGNVANESGFNPWRWQNDVVNLTSKYKGYGLVQFTPSYYYIGGRGAEAQFASYYAPNTSTSTTVSGADASDGLAQLMVIETYHSDKFLDRRSYCSYADLSDTYPYSSYKTLSDLWIATVGWLYNYEYPDDRSYSIAYSRYLKAQACYEIITGATPPTPTPTPTPTPPLPTYSSDKRVCFYITKKYKRRRGLI